VSDAKTDYLEDALLNHVLRNTAYSSPATIYIGLFTTMPSDDGTGGVEVSGGAYARQSVTFSAPSGGQVANNALVQFPTATADWGTVLGMGLFDALTGGNLLYYGTLTASKIVGIGDQLAFAASALTVGET
jgi:hypothetical protein